MSTATVTELEVLFTANTQQVDTAAKKVKDQADKIEKKPVDVKVEGDATDALAAMGRVEDEAKKIVSAKTMATVDANIERAETSLEKVQERLDYLHSVEATMEVTADIKRAKSALSQITRRRDALVSAKETMVVDADVSGAESAIDGLADDAGEAGAEGGEQAGQNIAQGIVGALGSTPVVGAVVGVAALLATSVVDAFTDGLQVEVRQDRLQALTGISEADAQRFALAAGEAYANTFGESIEANMDTARLALQTGLIDEDATTRQAQHVVQSLAGIADVLDEDVRPVSVAVTQLLKTGLASSAEEAFDLLATGAREGVNAQEDLLDTFTEYPALFARLGLDGPEALGLISQALDAGARNSDLAADALKEFQIRATDGSVLSAQGFEALGLSAEEMTAKIAAGGDSAAEGLGQVLDGLRDIEDPVARNAAAVALFGTQAEDLGDALFAMDLSTAVDQLNGVEGAAQAMFDTLSDNDATKMEEAQRNIEVATEGMKGALAAAFSEPLGDLATYVSENRGPVMQFFLDMANAGLDFARNMVNGAATAVEGIGDFVGGAAPAVQTVIDLFGIAYQAFDKITPGSQGYAEWQEWADGVTAGMEDFDASTEVAADTMRETLLPAIDGAQDKLNEFGIPVVQQADLHDASLKAANAIADVGYAADGSQISLESFDLANLNATTSGMALEDQILNSISALDAEAAAGAIAGETQGSLTEQYNKGRDALKDQLVAMGLTEDQAWNLISSYEAIPETESTDIDSNADARTVEVDDLAVSIETLPDGSVRITADTSSAQNAMDTFYSNNDGRRITVWVDSQGGQSFRVAGSSQIGMAAGGVLEYMAIGGLRPMDSVAQVVPPNTWRVVGDRGDVDEIYAPLDGSARSRQILMEGLLRMGMLPMADGAVTSPRGPQSTADRPSRSITVNTRFPVGRRELLEADRLLDLLEV